MHYGRDVDLFRYSVCLLPIADDAILTPDMRQIVQASLRQTNGKDISTAAQECAAYLQRTMPEEDHKCLAEEYLSQNIDVALRARRSSPWAADVPWQVFLQYVLPYAM